MSFKTSLSPIWNLEEKTYLSKLVFTFSTMKHVSFYFEKEIDAIKGDFTASEYQGVATFVIVNTYQRAMKIQQTSHSLLKANF